MAHPEPTSPEERADLARRFISRFDLQFPILLDTISNEVDDLYAAMPLRLYLIDEQGIVIFRTPAGSPGFDPEAWRDVIQQHLQEAGAA